jgi:MFS transporter, PAT family, beta-lactamase induction signal transducer AmpG
VHRPPLPPIVPIPRPDAREHRTRPWRWIPTLYFGQGLPDSVVMTLSVVMYKNRGMSNTEIALYTNWLYVPWVTKPLWSPLVVREATLSWVPLSNCEPDQGA